MPNTVEDEPTVQANSLGAVLNFVSELSLSEMAKKIGQALDLRFTDDVEGVYEEYPAVIANGAGLSFAVLGAPDPEYDIREDRSADFQFVVQSEPFTIECPGSHVDMSEYYARLLEKRAGLICQPHVISSKA